MESGKKENLEGTVEEITFHNNENGYTVMVISSNQEPVTVVGNFASVSEGEEVLLRGEWFVHPKFGRQFKAEYAELTMPSDVAGILRFLSSGIISGVREATALKIVEAFGAESLNVIENDANRLSSLKGISKDKARSIQLSFKEKFASRGIMKKLTDAGLTQKEAFAAYKIYNADAYDVFCENPYEFVNRKIYSFNRAEELTENSDFKLAVEIRSKALVVEILKHNSLNGHTCLPRFIVVKTAVNYLECSEDEAEKAVDDNLQGREIFSEDIDGKEFLFLPDMYNSELEIAQRIKVMVSYPPAQTEIFSSEIYAFEQSNDIEFDEKQRIAIETAVNKGLLILTGGPGTGKTTTVKGIITLMKNRGMNVALAAPTGRAAKRMTELTGFEAKTIHRLLEVEYKDGQEEPSFVYNRKNPLDTDAVIVDELSMVDVWLFNKLLDALPLHARLIMVGDKDQLPPVGAGNVLKDLTESNMIPVTSLDKVFRQALKSRIVTNAHKVVNGEMPDLSGTGENCDFFLLRENSYYLAEDKIVDLVVRRLPEAYGLDPVNDIQVLCPGKKGGLGSQSLNIMLQKRLNPAGKSKKELHNRGFILREGDKVMQVKNNYDVPWFKSNENGSGVFNGDIGILTRIDIPADIINVRFDDREAMYSLESASELELAYAMTVHKSQGSEFGCVVMPVLSVPSKLAYRNLFYTALTRAKSLIVLVGNEITVKSMVENDKKSRRYSALLHFLKVDNSGLIQ
ncbi:MAG: ATP-dependent RecD-like DNA helicase [Clostridiales bacterium]|nr:ATP-dependent RecD-like DNA helicase [Clostridiales bacterium]